MGNKCLFFFLVLWWMIPLSVWSQVEINLQPVKNDPYARFQYKSAEKYRAEQRKVTPKQSEQKQETDPFDFAQ